MNVVDREARSSDVIRVVGRYALHAAIAAGGMATVHFGRLLGPVGFSRTVAIKRLHAQYASDPEFVSMFLDEARLAARIRHPNVVPTLDVVATGGELFLVMEYVPGESLAKLSRGQRERAPNRIISTVMAGALHGLHAAHEAKDERGHPLGIVHRDVSPQNILVGTDGVPKILDFGVAKAAGRTQHTREGQIKGKLSYMPPEQLRGGNVTRQADIYAAGVILWELVTGQRLFGGDNEGVVIAKILEGKVEKPSRVATVNLRGTMNDRQLREVESLDRVILRALDMVPENRYATAREMAIDLERSIQPATASETGEWVEAVAREVLASRASKVSEIESSASGHMDADKVMSALAAKTTMTSPQMAGNATLAMSTAPVANGIPGVGARDSANFRPIPRQAVETTPPVTQPSSISVSAGLRIDANKHRSAIAAGIGVFVALLLVGAFIGARAIHASRSAAASANLSSSAASASAAPPSQVVVVAPASNSGSGVAAMPSATGTAPTTSLDAPVAADSTADPANPGNGNAGTAQTTQAAKPPQNTWHPQPHHNPPPPPPPPTATAPPAATNNNGGVNPCSPPFYYDSKGVKIYKQNCI